MKANPFIISELLIKRFRDELTDEESVTLEQWIHSDPKNKTLLDELYAESAALTAVHPLNNLDEAQAWGRILKKERRKSSRMIWYAAALLLSFCALSFSLYYYTQDNNSNRIIANKDKRFKNDVAPAQLGARLVRGEGVEIDVHNNITFAADGSIQNEGNQLQGEKSPVAALNTLIVPAAHFFSMTLSDGTKVWINANSELDFPSTFAAAERRVKLSGEAYFEVAPDKERPFYVETTNAQIRVLGTHFNVSAYTAKAVTSLVEGKVEVSSGTNVQLLLPGQMATVNAQGISLGKADILKSCAWKNNEFYFRSDNIVRIAQELQSWYGLEVSFASDVSLSQTYTGEIRRDANLSEVLTMLEFVSDLDFKIDKNKLLIQNQKI